MDGGQKDALLRRTNIKKTPITPSTRKKSGTNWPKSVGILILLNPLDLTFDAVAGNPTKFRNPKTFSLRNPASRNPKSRSPLPYYQKKWVCLCLPELMCFMLFSICLIANYHWISNKCEVKTVLIWVSLKGKGRMRVDAKTFMMMLQDWVMVWLTIQLVSAAWQLHSL